MAETDLLVPEGFSAALRPPLRTCLPHWHFMREVGDVTCIDAFFFIDIPISGLLSYGMNPGGYFG